MTTVDLLARILIGWCVLSVIIGGAYAVAMARHHSRVARRKPSPSWTDLTLSQPPVPTQADVDATWASVWPVDCAGRDEVALRLEQIAAAEGWTPVTEEWAA